MDDALQPESIKNRLANELRREIPPGVGERLDNLVNAVFEFHNHRDERTEPLVFDFRSLSGESLLPSREGAFGVADFLRLSQVFERSMVGMILSSDLPLDEKGRFVDDIQGFFDAFDTSLLGQLEEELVARGVLRRAPVLDDEAISRFLNYFGLSKGLADELADPVMLEVDGVPVYANPSAKALLGKDALQKSFFGPGGIISNIPIPSDYSGEWYKTTTSIKSTTNKTIETPVAWRIVNISNMRAALIMLPSANVFLTVNEMRKLIRDNRNQMELARRVQMQLLPEPTAFKRLSIHTLFNPAEALSGDFYQFFTNPGLEGLVIGDASGSGISASLIMAVAGATFRDACSGDICDPAAMLMKANAVLKDALGDDFFVTALILGVDPGTLEATYASAGHAGPILIKPDGKLRHLAVSGIPLGMFANPPQYDTYHTKLKPGDRLLFFTDGATESRNIKGEMYGIKRLQACIKRNAHLTGDALLRTISDDASTFLVNSDRADDMTLVLVEIT